MILDFIARLTNVHRDEARAVALSGLYFFFLLYGYYLLRPVREEMGLAGGIANLHWLFRATLLGTLILTPIFGALVARYPRRVFIPISYRFFMVNLVLFFIALKVVPEGQELKVGYVFYVWLSVFNMFVVSLFWAFMADGWGFARSKRLFGFIAIGGTLGAIGGSVTVAFLVEQLGRANLLLVSVVSLEGAVQCVRALARLFDARQSRVAQAQATAPTTSQASVETPLATEDPLQPTGGSRWAGLTMTLRSPYLLGICGYLFLYSFTSTFLYFEQQHIIDEAISGRDARTVLFAHINTWTNVVTLLFQVLLTSRIIAKLGVGWTLTLIPIVTAVGFMVLGAVVGAMALTASPVLTVLVVFQVVRRGGNFGLSRPARETLFTIVSREQKYKAKSFIDTFVYRGGDAVGESIFAGLGRLGMGLSGLAFTAVPLALIWGVIGLYLGHTQKRLAKQQGVDDSGSLAPSPQAA